MGVQAREPNQPRWPNPASELLEHGTPAPLLPSAGRRRIYRYRDPLATQGLASLANLDRRTKAGPYPMTRAGPMGHEELTLMPEDDVTRRRQALLADGMLATWPSHDPAAAPDASMQGRGWPTRADAA
jgi:hypothetical protein